MKPGNRIVVISKVSYIVDIYEFVRRVERWRHYLIRRWLVAKMASLLGRDSLKSSKELTCFRMF